MSNPVMERNPYFKQAPLEPMMQPAMSNSPQEVHAQYVQPDYVHPASSAMTYAEAMNKTGILLLTVIFSGIASVILLPLDFLPPVSIGTSLVAFIVGMVIAFKTKVSPALAFGYAVLEGIALGSLTGYVDTFVPGAAISAILGTTIVVAITLALHYSGKIRTTPKGRKFVIIVALAGIAFSFVNIAISMFSGTNMRTDMNVMGMPLGIILGIVMILVAAYMLISDFEMVQQAVDNNAPEDFAWTVAIGIVMTVLWIYIEVLRIVLILSRR